MAPCRCQRERRIQCELLPRYHAAKLGDFPPAVQEQVMQWLDNPLDGLLITGPVGTGKTHLAAAIMRRRLELGKGTIFRRAPALYAALREAYRTNEPEDRVLQDYL